VLGTSAGAVLGAALRCGMGVDELLAHQHGTTSELPDMRTIERETGDGRPPLPLPWIGSPRLVARVVTHPRTVNPVIAASALLPAGRGQLGSLIRLVTVLQTRLGVTGDGWVPGAPLWVVAVDYDSGRRTVFGRPGGPPSTVGEAVLASCSIPGWFTPQVIDGHRYVDGGVASSTSLGLLARPGAPQLDEVYVLAPLASHEYDRPARPGRGRRAGRAVPAHALAGRRGAGRAGGGCAGHGAHPRARRPRGHGRQHDEPAATRAGARRGAADVRDRAGDGRRRGCSRRMTGRPGIMAVDRLPSAEAW
jgi:predicted acylesterase/phospholipase RssA